MGKVSEFVNIRFGCETKLRESVVVLGAGTPVPVLPNNPDRFSWTIFNLGGAIGYVGFSSAVAALNGMQLAATGGIASSNAVNDGELPTHDVFGIGAGATTLYIVETIAR